MDLFDAIKSRRSCRSFLPEPVEPEKIDRILDAARWAPSPANSQPWEFTVITSRAVIDELYELSEDAKKTGHIELRGFSYVRPLPAAIEEGDGEDEALKHYSPAFIKDVPVVIAVSGLPVTAVKSKVRTMAQEGYKYACAAAIQNMLLAARAQDLAGLWFTFFDRQAVSLLLNIDPATRHLLALVCIGYPRHTPLAPDRVPLESRIRRME